MPNAQHCIIVFDMTRQIRLSFLKRINTHCQVVTIKTIALIFISHKHVRLRHECLLINNIFYDSSNRPFYTQSALIIDDIAKFKKILKFIIRKLATI